MLRFKSKKDYNRLKNVTTKIIGKYFLIIYLIDNLINESVAGITVSKKVGNAVVRNRVKRRLRAFLQSYMPPECSNFYICNIIALPSVVNSNWTDFVYDLNKCLNKVFISTEHLNDA